MAFSKVPVTSKPLRELQYIIAAYEAQRVRCRFLFSTHTKSNKWTFFHDPITVPDTVPISSRIMGVPF